MAKYTITIETLLKNKFDLGLKTYPIFNEDYRKTLNKHILDYYYIREIGFETAELFKHYLNNKMEMIMPFYNKLYKILEEKEQTLLNNLDITETFTGKTTDNDNTTRNGTSESTTNGTGNNEGKSVFQDTPTTGMLNTDIDNQKYATNITQNKNSSSSNSTANSTTNETDTIKRDGTNEYTKTIKGNNGGAYNLDLLQRIEEDFINIDNRIINELDDLFMGLF